MSKVKLTQEQAEEIRKIEDVDYAINILSLNKRPDNPLAELTIAEVARALYVGYEVEPEFKAGDWVVTKSGHIGEIEFINKVEGWVNIGDINDTKERGVCLAKTFNLNEIERHLTPSEIAQEKERRFFARYGRKVWKLRKGDILYNPWLGIRTVLHIRDSGKVSFAEDHKEYEIDEIKESYRVACFAENRLDVKDDE